MSEYSGHYEPPPWILEPDCCPMTDVAYKEVSWTSPELQQITMYVEEQGDLVLAKIPLSGPQLDAIEDIRRRAGQLMMDGLLYGNASERVDPSPTRAGVKSLRGTGMTRTQAIFLSPTSKNRLLGA